MSLAFDGPPRFTTMRASAQTLLQGMIELSPSLGYLERAYDDAKCGEFSRRT